MAVKKTKQKQGLLKLIVNFYENKTPGFVRDFLAILIPLFLLQTLQLQTDFIRDNVQVSFFDLKIPLLFNLVMSILLAIIFYYPFKKNKFLGLLVAIGAYEAIKYRVDTKLQPVWDFFRSSDFVSKIIDFLGVFNLIIFATLAILITYFMFKKIDKVAKAKNLNLNIFYKGLFISLLVASIIQLYSTTRITVSQWDQFFYKPGEFDSSSADSNPEIKPDIYYIVLDRYTNDNVLKNQLDFDNSEFTSFLENNGFYVKHDAFANYPNTASSVSSTLKADYHQDLMQQFGSEDLQTYVPYFNSTKYSPVIKSLKDLGYDYYNLGSYYEISSEAPLASYDAKSGYHINIFNRIYPLGSFAQKELKNSIYWKVIAHGIKIGNFSIISYGGLGQRDQSLFSINKLKEIADTPGNARFVFAHILIPHNPYYFNADGSFSDSPSVDNQGRWIRDKYTDQLKFVNGQMRELIEKIKQKDSNAIIILQADEGPYPSQEKMNQDGSPAQAPEMNSDEKAKLSQEDLQMKYGVLASYHIPNVSQEDLEKNINSVNVFRIILNNYFGYNLPYLPDCHYSLGGKGKIYHYTEISKRMFGVESTECK